MSAVTGCEVGKASRDLSKLTPSACFTYEQLVRISPSSEEKAWHAAMAASNPDYCPKCRPQGFGCCRCEIACNE
jgi:hypothetical protein